MLYSEFLNVEDKHVNMMVIYLTALRKYKVFDSYESLIEIAESSATSFILSSTVDDIEYSIALENNKNGGGYITVLNEDDASSNRLEITFNKNRILCMKCSVLVGYTTVEWTLFFCNDKLIISTGDILQYDEINEHLFQYDTVCPLAGLIMEYVNV